MRLKSETFVRTIGRKSLSPQYQSKPDSDSDHYTERVSLMPNSAEGSRADMMRERFLIVLRSQIQSDEGPGLFTD